MAVTINAKGTSVNSFKIGKKATLDASGVSVNATLTVPNATGTLALLSDISGAGGVPLSNANPVALGTPSPGVAAEASRSDHVHQIPDIPPAPVDGEFREFSDTVVSGYKTNNTTEVYGSVRPAITYPTETDMVIYRGKYTGVDAPVISGMNMFQVGVEGEFAGTSNLDNLQYVNGLYFVVIKGGFATSKNLLDWNSVYISDLVPAAQKLLTTKLMSGQTFYTPTYDGVLDVWVMMCGGLIFMSHDGVNWGKHETSIGGSYVSYTAWHRVGNKVIIPMESGMNYWYSTDDGKNFTSASVTGNPSGTMRGFGCVFDGKFYTISYDTSTLYVFDPVAETWATDLVGLLVSENGLFEVGGKLFVIDHNPSTPSASIWTLDAGSSVFTQRLNNGTIHAALKINSFPGVFSFGYLNNRLYYCPKTTAAGVSLGIPYSEDFGATWQSTSVVSTKDIKDMAHLNNTLGALSSTQSLISDGQRLITFTKSQFRDTYSDASYRFYVSNDGAKWYGVLPTNTQHTNRVVYTASTGFTASTTPLSTLYKFPASPNWLSITTAAHKWDNNFTAYSVGGSTTLTTTVAVCSDIREYGGAIVGHARNQNVVYSTNGGTSFTKITIASGANGRGGEWMEHGGELFYTTIYSSTNRNITYFRPDGGTGFLYTKYPDSTTPVVLPAPTNPLHTSLLSEIVKGYDNKFYVAAHRYITATFEVLSPGVYESSDLTNWTFHETDLTGLTPVTNVQLLKKFNNAYYLFCGGKTFKSSDMLLWGAVADLDGMTPLAVTALSDIMLAVNATTVMYTLDGTSWHMLYSFENIDGLNATQNYAPTMGVASTGNPISYDADYVYILSSNYTVLKISRTNLSVPLSYGFVCGGCKTSATTNSKTSYAKAGGRLFQAVGNTILVFDLPSRSWKKFCDNLTTTVLFGTDKWLFQVADTALGARRLFRYDPISGARSSIELGSGVYPTFAPTNSFESTIASNGSTIVTCNSADVPAKIKVSTDDGVTWQEVTIDAASSHGIVTVQFFEGKFYAYPHVYDTDSKFYTSTDGVTWTELLFGAGLTPKWLFRVKGRVHAIIAYQTSCSIAQVSDVDGDLDVSKYSGLGNLSSHTDYIYPQVAGGTPSTTYNTTFIYDLKYIKEHGSYVYGVFLPSTSSSTMSPAVVRTTDLQNWYVVDSVSNEDGFTDIVVDTGTSYLFPSYASSLVKNSCYEIPYREPINHNYLKVFDYVEPEDKHVYVG